MQQVQQNPVVVQNAPSHLSDAQATLAKAEQEWENDGDREETSHLAYVSEQQSGVALAVAQQKAAEAEAQQLVAQRDDIRLAARSREVELARGQAQVATARAQSLEQELAALKAKRNRTWLGHDSQENVLFEYNKADLKPGGDAQSPAINNIPQEHPDRTLLIEGHTDSTGSDSYNLDLSHARGSRG